MAQMSSCMGCGTPIPELLMDDGFNFRCTKCGCETRPQDTLEEAERLWNEGRIIPLNEEAFWKNIGNGRKHIATLPAKKVYLSEHKVFEHGKWFENQTENKITDSKIMEALKCCYMPTQECANCPYKGKEDDDMQCFDMLKRDTLDLINRQKAKIERLGNPFLVISQQTEDAIESIRKCCSPLILSSDTCELKPLKSEMEIKSELLENVVYRLKKICIEWDVGYLVFAEDQFDELIKELAGEF